MTTADNEDTRRFRDPLTRLWRYQDEILVRCPACDAMAAVLPDPAAAGSPLRRRLSCLACGHTAAWTAPRSGDFAFLPEGSGPEDPYFGLPLWLRADCCGANVLWAYNVDHLDLLEAYLAAKLRERGDYRGSMSLVERLPAWLKAAKHRDEALRTIGRLRASLPASRSQRG